MRSGLGSFQTAGREFLGGKAKEDGGLALQPGSGQVNGKPEDCPAKIVARRIDAQLDEDHIGFNFASAHFGRGNYATRANAMIGGMIQHWILLCKHRSEL